MRWRQHVLDVLHGADTVESVGCAEVAGLECGRLRNPRQVRWLEGNALDLGAARVLDADVDRRDEAAFVALLDRGQHTPPDGAHGSDVHYRTVASPSRS